jgi:hypothetical protein
MQDLLACPHAVILVISKNKNKMLVHDDECMRLLSMMSA